MVDYFLSLKMARTIFTVLGTYQTSNNEKLVISDRFDALRKVHWIFIFLTILKLKKSLGR